MRPARVSILWLLTIAAPLAAGVGCAARRGPASRARLPRPPEVVAEVRVPAVPTPAQLTLGQILPPAVLPSRATRPAGSKARPPLEALTLYAEACDNLLKHR